MSYQEGKTFHLNQLLPEIVRFAFPELREVDIIAERAQLGNSFTDHEFDEGTYTIRLCNELNGAPMTVIAGAIAMELQQIAKKVHSPIRYGVQRFFERLSPHIAAQVSRKEDLDMINRGLGGNYTQFNEYITTRCEYAWNPIDGYSPSEFDILLNLHGALRRYPAFQ